MIAQRPTFSPSAELSRTAELLFRYPILAIPTAIASAGLVAVLFAGLLSLVAAVLAGHAAAGHAGTVAGLATGLVTGASLTLLGVTGLYIAQAMVVAAAPDVLAGGPPNLAAGLRTTLARLPQLAVAGALTFALAALLCITIVGIPFLIVLGYLLMYAPAAVIIGNEGGVEAIATSVRLATTRVNDSLVCWLGLILALIAGNVATGFTIHIPLVNLLAGFVVGGFSSAYAALLTVRFYLELRKL